MAALAQSGHSPSLCCLHTPSIPQTLGHHKVQLCHPLNGHPGWRSGKVTVSLPFSLCLFPPHARHRVIRCGGVSWNLVWPMFIGWTSELLRPGLFFFLTSDIFLGWSRVMLPLHTYCCPKVICVNQSDQFTQR